MVASISGIFGGLALGVGVACATAAVLAQSGRVSPLLDVLAHLAPAYAVGGVLALAAARWLEPRRRWTAGVAGLVAVAGGLALVAPAARAPPSSPAGPGPRLKVIQLNALRSNADIGRVADWLIAEQPDVVTINEARHDLRDLLLKRTGWATSGAHGNLIIFTPERRLRMDRPKLPGADLTFVNATYPGPAGPMEVVSAHLDWPTRPVFAGQQRDLVRVINRLPQERMILTGDFNAAPWSFSIRRLERQIRVTRRDGAIPTYPARIGPWRWPLPFLPIDHVYAGPGWATVEVRRGPYVGSDHYPVVVTLAPVSPH